MNIPKYLKITAIGLAIIGATAACGSAGPTTTGTAVRVPAVASTDFTMDGTLTLVSWKSVKNNCEGVGGYQDIGKGAPVTVTDDQGATVGLGALGQGVASTDSECVYRFLVPGVPTGHDFYGIEVAHRGIVTYPEAMAQIDVQLNLG